MQKNFCVILPPLNHTAILVPNRIEPVHKSSDSTEIDELEKYLIMRFEENWVSELKRKVHKLLTGKTIPKCDNDAVGGGEMDDSNTYYVYVVVKD